MCLISCVLFYCGRFRTATRPDRLTRRRIGRLDVAAIARLHLTCPVGLIDSWTLRHGAVADASLRSFEGPAYNDVVRDVR